MRSRRWSSMTMICRESTVVAGRRRTRHRFQVGAAGRPDRRSVYFRIDIRAIDMYGALPQMFGVPSIFCWAIWSWRFAQRVWAFRLKIADDDTRRFVDDARKRLVRLRDALDDLDSQGGMATRSPAVSFRGGGGAVAAVLARTVTMPSAVSKILDDLRDRGGLKGTDVANITAVSPATVSRWTSGKAFPHPKTQLVISDLRYVVDRLAEFYSPDEARIWLYSKHPLLNGERAIDLIHGGRTDEVLAVIESLDQGTYT